VLQKTSRAAIKSLLIFLILALVFWYFFFLLFLCLERDAGRGSSSSDIPTGLAVAGASFSSLFLSPSLPPLSILEKYVQYAKRVTLLYSSVNKLSPQAKK